MRTILLLTLVALSTVALADVAGANHPARCDGVSNVVSQAGATVGYCAGFSSGPSCTGWYQYWHLPTGSGGLCAGLP